MPVDPTLFAGCPDSWPQLVDEAERRGYIELGDGRVVYKCAASHDEAWLDPEEKVRAGVYAWLILEKEYPAEAIKVEVNVPRRTPSDYADIVVYTDPSCSTPYLVVEAKKVGTPPGDFRQAIEQAFGNANSLRDTTFALTDSGDHSALHQVAGYPHAERRDNLLGTRDDLPKTYGSVSQFRLLAGDPEHDIRPKSAALMESLVRRAHALIWAGGKRDPLIAFDEWCKLLFAKIYDERHTANNDPRRFQVGREEQDVVCANRVRALYLDAQNEDPSIFTEDLQLLDDKIVQVVRAIEGVAFAQMDIDSLGMAFESFFGAIFRGELGQYFTRRELCRFVCALLGPTDLDRILDPTAGSGGFLLESLIQVWRHIEEAYVGQPDQERRKYDFAHNNLFGIEIHPILGRICQTNLMLHKDGHTNIEPDRSCLDTSFGNPMLANADTRFSLIVGNPPFGDHVKEGDRDHLGANRLSAFELPGSNQVLSEIIVLERSIKWLRPGTGRLGMVVPDGVLNNPGSGSRCPAFRRFLFRHAKVLAIVSLPDFAFRKSGAQNKTSLLFLRRFSEDEQRRMQASMTDHLRKVRHPASAKSQDKALAAALQVNDYQVFLAEADHIGYTPAGATTPRNDLYQSDGLDPKAPASTILGQYRLFRKNPGLYQGRTAPACMQLNASTLFQSHRTRRIDPKYHLFKRFEERHPPDGLTSHRLGDLLVRRREAVVPNDQPDVEFLTITLTQEGRFKPREAGKGKNPPDWHGAYFKEGQKWYTVRAGDILISRIDLWKGCIGVVPETYDGGVVTNEFPAYYVDPAHQDVVDARYLQLLLRTSYFQRAIRAITTGHSNRRRTQEHDFDALRVPLLSKDTQERIVATIQELEDTLGTNQDELAHKLAVLNQITMSQITPGIVEQLLASSAP